MKIAVLVFIDFTTIDISKKSKTDAINHQGSADCTIKVVFIYLNNN